MVYYSSIFFFGLLIGSFLNAVIYRLYSGESIVKTRSHCLKCGHVLSWYELIPVASFIIQGGRCRACKKSISLQYPFVEIATALLFVLIFYFSVSSRLHLAYYFVIASLLMVIFVYDLKHYIIPDKIIYPAIGIAFLGNLGALGNPLLAAVGVSVFFATIFVLSRGRWLGFGDVKLAFFMGLFLGWPNILVSLFVAFTLGGIIGIGLVILRKKTMRSQVPFGPFLVAGIFIAMFWGGKIIEWYLGLLL